MELSHHLPCFIEVAEKCFIVPTSAPNVRLRAPGAIGASPLFIPCRRVVSALVHRCVEHPL
jgi:hypothetical protein